jgi:hypothetical protein
MSNPEDDGSDERDWIAYGEVIGECIANLEAMGCDAGEIMGLLALASAQIARDHKAKRADFIEMCNLAFDHPEGEDDPEDGPPPGGMLH